MFFLSCSIPTWFSILYYYVMYKLLELNRTYSGFFMNKTRDDIHVTQKEANCKPKEYTGFLTVKVFQEAKMLIQLKYIYKSL